MSRAELGSQTAPPLVFVYLGFELPSYTEASLRFAAKGYPGDTILLTNSNDRLASRFDARVEVIESWYDTSLFNSFRENTTLDPHFRSGFWLHVVERFFVLRQFMEKEGLGRLFHAELDVMVFDLHGVAGACDAHGSGVFAVMDDRTRALASLFYVNSPTKFDHFLSFALDHADMKNEMEMIGTYLQEFPENGHSLPSDRFFDRGVHPLSPSAVGDDLGLFDANAFGQWLFGLDPKNIKLVVRNHFRNPMATFPIHRLRFQIPIIGRRLVARMPGAEQRQVRTLHVHSKIVRRLVFRPMLMYYLWVNRFPVRWTITQKKGALSARVLRNLLRGRVSRVLTSGIQPAGSLASRFLLYLASRSAVPMSERQRELVVKMLPRAVADVPASGGVTRREKRDSSANSATVHPELRLEDNPPESIWLSLDAGNKQGEHKVSSSQAITDLFGSEQDLVPAISLAGRRADLNPWANESHRQSLVVTTEKFDSEWRIVLSTWSGEVDDSVSFSPRIQVIRPAWVREMFGARKVDLGGWFALVPGGLLWTVFIQAYGGWARSHHPREVQLVREPSGVR